MTLRARLRKPLNTSGRNPPIMKRLTNAGCADGERGSRQSSSKGSEKVCFGSHGGLRVGVSQLRIIRNYVTSAPHGRPRGLLCFAPFGGGRSSCAGCFKFDCFHPFLHGACSSPSATRLFKFLSPLAPAIGQITTDPPGALSPRS